MKVFGWLVDIPVVASENLKNRQTIFKDIVASKDRQISYSWGEADFGEFPFFLGIFVI